VNNYAVFKNYKSIIMNDFMFEGHIKT
jgi:hypothetical protein